MIDEVEAEWAYQLAQLRWGDEHGVPVCDLCGSALWQSHRRPRLFGCSHHSSRRRSVTSGTLLQYTKLSLERVVQMIRLLLSSDPPSSVGLAERMGVHENTAFLWRHKIMAAIAQGGDPLVGVVMMARTQVPTCGAQPNPPTPCSEADPALLRFYNVHVPLWPVAVFSDYDRVVLQGSAALNPIRQIQRLLHTDDTPVTWPSRMVAAVAVKVRAEITYLHFGVSVRWLPRYVQYIAQRGRHEGPLSVLAQLLRLPWLDLNRLRPCGSPAGVLDASLRPRLAHTPMVGARGSGFYSGRASA